MSERPLVVHLQRVHFLLVTVSLGVLAATVSPPSNIQKAYHSAEALWQLSQNWKRDWFEMHGTEISQNLTSEFEHLDILNVLSPDAPRASEWIVGLKRWALGADESPEPWGIASQPDTIGDFMELWDKLRRIDESGVFVLTGCYEKATFLLPEADAGWRSIDEVLPSDTWPEIRLDAILGSASSLKSSVLWPDAYTRYVRVSGRSKNYIERERAERARRKRLRDLRLHAPGLESRDDTPSSTSQSDDSGSEFLEFWLPIKGDTTSVDSQEHLSQLARQSLNDKMLPSEWANWRAGTVRESFSSLFAECENLKSCTLKDMRDHLQARLLNQGQSLKIFGFEFPPSTLRVWGAIAITVLQLYYWVHLTKFMRLACVSKSGDVIPWIGAYRDSVAAQALLFVSSVLLPTGVVLSLVMSASEPVMEAKLQNGIVGISILLSLRTAVAILRWWRSLVQRTPMADQT